MYVIVVFYRFLILLQVVIANSTKHHMQSRIYPGRGAPNGKIFYQGYLSYDGNFNCGGSIIHHRWALTAAHCIKDTGIPTFTVGTIYLYGFDGTTYGVEKLLKHIYYQSKEGPPRLVIYDIGLIRTSSDIVFNDKVDFIPLARDSSANYNGQAALMSGWGHSKYGGLASGVLQYEYAPVMAVSDCRLRTNAYYWYDDLHVCISSAYGEEACKGDSGGPLVIDNAQIGIVSGVTACSGSGLSVFTKVSTFIPWIEGVFASYGDYL